MRPEWFSTTALSTSSDTTQDSLEEGGQLYPAIPFAQMWETDEVWLPLLISKQRFFGRADFTQDGDVYKPYKWWYGVSLD
jgi:8-oxo-dGTP diphosphatase/2-hydroxy-dATP diphosphatase